jgi:hypothetical protein
MGDSTSGRVGMLAIFSKAIVDFSPAVWTIKTKARSSKRRLE